MELIYKITVGELINAIILSITAIIVYIYTRAEQKSNEIQEKPILNLYLRESKENSRTKYMLRLRNVGNGPAYNIKFFGIKADGYIYYPDFDEPNPILERNGDEKTIDLWVATPKGGVEVYDLGVGFERFLMRLFDSSVQEKKYDDVARSAAVFLITYKGVNDEKYYSIFRLYSKIVPILPAVYDLVIEFIANGRGALNITEAKCLCATLPIMKKNE